MCGICGALRLDDAPVDRHLIARMTHALAHRGPDGEGFHIGDRIGLGHRRLSIIDLEGGSQPIYNEDGSIAVVFNGEIYNFVELRAELERAGHLFRTRSDTETIVHAYEQWGTECVDRFNGMFAFALWDDSEKRLFIARDHLGIKPIYYCLLGAELLFASEIKALLASGSVPRAVDTEAISELFTFRFVPAPRTLFAGIRKLPAGHLLVADGRGMQISRYWRTIPQHRTFAREADLIAEYQELLLSTVRLQLRSDVPVGLFLSSGVDSGCLLALMRQELAGPVHTFTIGFEGGHKTNETDDARALACNFEAHHHELTVGPQSYLDYYERYLWDLEEPVGNETAAAFHFVSQLAAQEVKVALTGQGADEPWGGYHRYIGVALSEYYRRLPGIIRNGLVKPIVAGLAGNERLKRGVASLDEPDVLTRFAKVYAFFTADMRADLFSAHSKFADRLRGFDAKSAIAHLRNDVEHLDPVSQMLYIDTRASLPDDLLMVCDKTSMASSLEARVPFLDRRLVEFVESLPVCHKLRHGGGKYLHKKAIRRWLPNTIVYRKKKGFSNPVRDWLRGQMRAYVEGCLFDPASGLGEYFDLDYIRRMLRLHETGRENYMRQIYLLISFAMWHRTFMRST